MSSTKRAWKLQEFVAHGSNVNCLALGHKSGHVMVTGGEDKKVNMWTVGKPNCIMSLTGHTSPVEAVRFGNAEEIVVAGSMSGALKIWDLEAAKIVRTLTGHKSNIRSVDFHPYGDFVASGSLDTNIKIWDIRRKGCIYTYKGHTNCVNSIRFSPDGRWIASAGEDGLLKLWDLTAGKTLTDLKGHTDSVTCVEFHPHDFLLASGSADRTVQFWDLESFQLVSRTDGDSTGIKTIRFHPEGLCLYGGATDVLKSYSWEPARCCDSISMGWGRVADISIAQNQLIGATFSQTNVSTFVVDLQNQESILRNQKKVQPVGGSEPLSPPNSSRGRRSFCIERPPTQSSKRIDPKEAPEDAITPAGDEEDDSNSFAQIEDPEDYNQIFRPKHTLAYDAAPARVKPFPAPAEERDRPSPSRPVQQTPPERDPPVTSRREPPPSKPTSVRPPSAHREPSREKTARERPGREPTREKPVSRGGGGERHVPPVAPPTASPASVPGERKKQSVGLDMDDFLPKAAAPNLDDAHLPSEMSEAEAISAIMRGHDSMAAVLTSRHKNLQIIRALWTGGNIKTAIDSAISMRDQAVMVDVFNIIVQKSSLWSLDMCGLLLPTIKDLISSKYETYVSTGCAALKLVLKNFAPVIKANMTAPPSIGVDISREERYNKCQQCYGVLMNIRPLLDTKHPMYNKLVSKFRELQLLISQLD